jgi:hypothetical protein
MTGHAGFGASSDGPDKDAPARETSVIFQSTAAIGRTYRWMRRTTGSMTQDLSQTLDRAGAALRRSVATVRRAPATLASPDAADDHATIRPRRADTALDQSIAALQAVVWIASFVQSFFNEIRGRADDL